MYRERIINNLSLKLLLCGRFKVTSVTKKLVNEDVVEKVVSEAIVDSQNVQEYTFSYENVETKRECIPSDWNPCRKAAGFAEN